VLCADDAALGAHEFLEDGELLVGQHDRVAVSGHPAARGIETESRAGEDRRCGRT
jgi:hypothetical protein